MTVLAERAILCRCRGVTPLLEPMPTCPTCRGRGWYLGCMALGCEEAAVRTHRVRLGSETVAAVLGWMPRVTIDLCAGHEAVYQRELAEIERLLDEVT